MPPKKSGKDKAKKVDLGKIERWWKTRSETCSTFLFIVTGPSLEERFAKVKTTFNQNCRAFGIPTTGHVQEQLALCYTEGSAKVRTIVVLLHSMGIWSFDPFSFLSSFPIMHASIMFGSSTSQNWLYDILLKPWMNERSKFVGNSQSCSIFSFSYFFPSFFPLFFYLYPCFIVK